MENKLVSNDNLLVGVDASRSNVKQRTGTEYYSFEIIKEIVKNGGLNFRLYSKTPIDYLDFKALKNVENKVMKFPRLWSQIRLSYEIWQNPPDVSFFPAHTIPFYHGKKTVITLHDVGFKYFPELYTPLERYYHDYCMGFSVRHATKIIAISNATKKDLIKFYKADPKKIEVIYHGFDKEKYRLLRAGEKPARDIQKMSPYIYFIGRLEAKKNIASLVKAYRELRKDKNIRHKLVLAGRPGYQYSEIARQIEILDPEISKDVIQLGYVSDDKATELMRHADIFAFPSRFEGFGMPLVEAMASGVPIIASNSSSIPEITQDCGLMSDPDDYKKMSENISSIISNHKLRAELIKKGLDRSKQFDWEKCSHETIEVIKSAAR